MKKVSGSSGVAQLAALKGVRSAGDVAFALNARMFRIMREVARLCGVSRRESLRFRRDPYLRFLARRLACAESVMAERGLMEGYQKLVASQCMDGQSPLSFGGEA